MLRTRQGANAIATARLWAEVDLEAVRVNVWTLRARLRPGCQLIAVVKADGYGHGAVPVARAALAAGAVALAVGSAAEGARLRAAGIQARILVIGPSLLADVPLLHRHDLVPAVADLELAAALAAGRRGPVDVQIEVDTGMRRHGVAAADAPAFFRRLLALPALRLAGLYTHFAGLDRAALPALRAQLRALLAVRHALASEHDAAPLLSACNTLATCLLPAAHLDAVRIGGGLYGFATGAPDVELRPALALKSRIAALRPARAGDEVGYGGAHRCAAATRLALLPCGYADGLPRAQWDGAQVLLRGQRARIVGHVSMNQLVVDVGHVAEAAVGDEVVLLGAQQGERLCAEQRTPPGGSAYEVTCLLPAGLLRLYRGTAADAAEGGAGDDGNDADRSAAQDARHPP